MCVGGVDAGHWRQRLGRRTAEGLQPQGGSPQTFGCGRRGQGWSQSSAGAGLAKRTLALSSPSVLSLTEQPL